MELQLENCSLHNPKYKSRQHYVCDFTHFSAPIVILSEQFTCYFKAIMTKSTIHQECLLCNPTEISVTFMLTEFAHETFQVDSLIMRGKRCCGPSTSRRPKVSTLTLNTAFNFKMQPQTSLNFQSPQQSFRVGLESLVPLLAYRCAISPSTWSWHIPLKTLTQLLLFQFYSLLATSTVSCFLNKTGTVQNRTEMLSHTLLLYTV